MQDIEFFVPGFRKALERVPTTRAAYQRLVIALHDSAYTPRMRAQLGLYVAQQIGCDYCQWAFARAAASAGLNAEDVFLATIGTATDRREDACLKLAARMVRGGELRQVPENYRSAVLSRMEIAEMGAHLAFAVLTCFVIQDVAPAGTTSSRSRREA